MRFWWNPWGEWAIQGADGRRSTEDEAESLLASLHPIAGSLPACTASHWPQRPRSLRPATPLYAQSWVNTKRKEEGRVALKRVNRQGGGGGQGMARSSRNGKELPNAPFTRYMCPTFTSSAGPTRIYISFPLKSQ